MRLWLFLSLCSFFLIGGCKKGDVRSDKSVEQVPVSHEQKFKLSKVPSMAAEMITMAPQILKIMKKMPAEEPVVDQALSKRLAGWGLPEFEFQNMEFDSADVRYVWSRRSLWERAHVLTDHFGNIHDKVAALNRWIYLHANSDSYGSHDENIGLMPTTVLWRGYGFCDRQSMALVELCRQIGIQSLLYVFRLPNGESPHTVAAYLVNGQWYFADPYNGIVYEDAQGMPLSFDKIVATPKLLKTYDVFKEHRFFQGFLGGGFRLPIDPRALTPRMLSIRKPLQEKWGAIFGQDMIAEEKLYQSRVPVGRSFGIWHYPVKYVRQWRTEGIRETLLVITRGLTGGTLKGRAAHIAGQIDLALLEYEKVERPDYLTFFYRAQCYFEKGELRQAKKLFESVIDRPDGKRVAAICHLYLAIIHETLGNKSKAKEYFDASPSMQEVVRRGRK